MDANQAVIDVGAQLEKARSSSPRPGRLIVRNNKIVLIRMQARQEGDILIDHLDSKAIDYGLSSAKWNHIEERIRVLILKGIL